MRKLNQVLSVMFSVLLITESVCGNEMAEPQVQPFVEIPTKSGEPMMRLSAWFSDTPTQTDNTVVYFKEATTCEYDGMYDALKLMNTDITVPSFFTITPGGTNLSINGMPPMTGATLNVALGLKIDKDGFISIKIKDIEASLVQYRIFLSDNVKGTEQDLLPNQEYKIYLEAGQYKDRFSINISSISTGVTENTNFDDVLKIYSAYGILNAEVNTLTDNNGTLAIYGLSGQTIFSDRITDVGHHEYNTNLINGIYVATFTSGNVRVAKKIFIKNQ